MRRADRAACNLPNDLSGAQLMSGIARGKLRSHRIGRYALIFFQPRAQRSFIQRSGLPARMIMSAIQRDHRITLQRLFQPMAVQIPRIKSDIDQPHTTPLPLNQSIGGQSCRQRGQGNLTRRNIGLGQYGPHRRANAQRQIGARGQRFSTGNHIGVITDQHRICIGAARINAQ